MLVPMGRDQFVRTPAGVKKYGLPIGSPIKARALASMAKKLKYRDAYTAELNRLKKGPEKKSTRTWKDQPPGVDPAAMVDGGYEKQDADLKKASIKLFAADHVRDQQKVDAAQPIPGLIRSPIADWQVVPHAEYVNRGVAKDTFNEYLSYSYKDMNDRLRKGDDDAYGSAKNMFKYLGVETENPMITYRGIQSYDFDIRQVLDSNGVFRDNAYVSTAVSPAFPESWASRNNSTNRPAVVLRVSLPAGSSIVSDADVANDYGVREVILPPGTVFHITGAKESDKGWYDTLAAEDPQITSYWAQDGDYEQHGSLRDHGWLLIDVTAVTPTLDEIEKSSEWRPDASDASTRATMDPATAIADGLTGWLDGNLATNKGFFDWNDIAGSGFDLHQQAAMGDKLAQAKVAAAVMTAVGSAGAGRQKAIDRLQTRDNYAYSDLWEALNTAGVDVKKEGFYPPGALRVNPMERDPGRYLADVTKQYDIDNPRPPGELLRNAQIHGLIKLINDEQNFWAPLSKLYDGDMGDVARGGEWAAGVEAVMGDVTRHALRLREFAEESQGVFDVMNNPKLTPDFKERFLARGRNLYYWENPDNHPDSFRAQSQRLLDEVKIQRDRFRERNEELKSGFEARRQARYRAARELSTPAGVDIELARRQKASATFGKRYRVRHTRDDDQLIDEIARAMAMKGDVRYHLQKVAAANGLDPDVMRAAYTLAGRGTADMPNSRLKGFTQSTRAIKKVRQIELKYRAAYVLSATRRMQASVEEGMSVRQAQRKESINWQRHEAARRNRLDSVRMAEEHAVWYGDVLGWYLNPLLNNDIECVIANGNNFRASEGTVIGYPGSVHPNCGCVSGPPHAQGEMVNDVFARIRGTKIYAKAVLAHRIGGAA